MIRAGTFRFALGLILMAGSGVAGLVNYLSPPPQVAAREASPFAHCTGMRVISEDGDSIVAELALTPAEQERGLQGRVALDEGGGMIFIFSEPSRPSFWMKDVRFPLDLVFISPDGKVSDYHRSAAPGSEAFMTPEEPVLAVVETGPGAFRRLEAGMRFRFACLWNQVGLNPPERVSVEQGGAGIGVRQGR